MQLLRYGGRGIGAVMLTLALFLTSTGSVFAHARYDRSEPASGAALDGSPFVLQVWFTQELTSKSTIYVVDEYGVQVDLGDGHVDLNDPVRKLMLVSLPELPPGIYTVHFAAESAEDGHTYPGAIAFGVGMEAPAGELPLEEEPAAGAVTTPTESFPTMVLDAY